MYLEFNDQQVKHFSSKFVLPYQLIYYLQNKLTNQIPLNFNHRLIGL